MGSLNVFDNLCKALKDLTKTKIKDIGEIVPNIKHADDMICRTKQDKSLLEEGCHYKTGTITKLMTHVVIDDRYVCEISDALTYNLKLNDKVQYMAFSKEPNADLQLRKLISAHEPVKIIMKSDRKELGHHGLKNDNNDLINASICDSDSNNHEEAKNYEDYDGNRNFLLSTNHYDYATTNDTIASLTEQLNSIKFNSKDNVSDAVELRTAYTYKNGGTGKHYSNDVNKDLPYKFPDKISNFNSENYYGLPDVPNEARCMMKNIGYQSREDLGKHSQGCVEPVKTIMKDDQKGLGHYVSGLKEAAGIKWDPQEEDIKVIEDIEWLSCEYSFTLTAEYITNWIKTGPKKKAIEDETHFCDPEIVRQIVSSKNVFDKLSKVEIQKARNRSNPYETIHNAGFLNRAAVKMANMNKACDFMFTEPQDLDDNELLYFADVCSGPGGFSEYILSRKKWHAKGFGFTLKNEHDFTLDEFHAGPCETFHPFYGPKENGDICDSENQEAFKSLIMKHTSGQGVHFMMADGALSVEGQESIQKILTKQLYLCQCLIALMIVRPRGHFVTNLFDLFTPFSVGLVYLLYRCFDSICIFKPNSSRPANSERYLICKWKKPDTQAIIEYLSRANHLLLKKDYNNDVTQLVPLNKLEADKMFMKYIRNSNTVLGKKQMINLLKIAAFCEDTMLIEPKQADMRKECLAYWELPDRTRVTPRHVKAEDKIRNILNSKLLGREAQQLTRANVKDTILKQPYDWFYMPCSSGQYTDKNGTATFYLGLGRTNVLRYVEGEWDTIDDLKIELPADTLIYAELVHEFRWTGKSFDKTYVLHILDAYMLGGEDVSSKYITQRYACTKKFCDALWKPSQHDYVSVRAKKIYMLDLDIEQKLQISQRRVKSVNYAIEFPKNYLERDNEFDTELLYFEINSVLFLKSTSHSWSRISKITKQPYVFNLDNGKKEDEIRRPSEAEASFTEAFEKRIIWYWPYDSLNMDTVVELIRNQSKNV